MKHILKELCHEIYQNYTSGNHPQNWVKHKNICSEHETKVYHSKYKGKNRWTNLKIQTYRNCAF